MEGRVIVLQEDIALREFVLVHGWYQERCRRRDQLRRGTGSGERGEM